MGKTTRISEIEQKRTDNKKYARAVIETVTRRVTNEVLADIDDLFDLSLKRDNKVLDLETDASAIRKLIRQRVEVITK